MGLPLSDQQTFRLSFSVVVVVCVCSLLDPEVAVDPGALLKKKWKNGDSLSAVVSKVTGYFRNFNIRMKY